MLDQSALVIVNPSSAAGKTGRRWSQLAPHVKRILPHAKICMTQHVGHATQLAKQAALQNVSQIVAVGGDGTIHEVLNGLFDEQGQALSPNLILSPLPMGTGSDLCRSLGIPRDPKQAVQLLNQEAQTIDVGHVKFYRNMPSFDCESFNEPIPNKSEVQYSKVFLNIGSFGLSGAVARHFEIHGKGGSLSYLLGIFKASSSYQNSPVELTLKGVDQEPKVIRRTLYTCAIANAQYFGNGMHVAPNAHVNDCLLDCVLVGDLSILEVVQRMPALYRGKHLKKPKFESYQAQSVYISTQDPHKVIWVELDGELSGVGPAEFSILPQVLKVTAERQAIGLTS
jgi:diacylglycerol kinase (ATP)